MNSTNGPSARSPELAEADRAARDEAHSLLSRAGSDQAQRAVESAVGQKADSSQRDAFALRWKFGSYLEMFEASKPLATIDEKHWLATLVGEQQWIVWNEQGLAAEYTAASLEEAKQLLESTSPSSAKPEKAPPSG